MKVKKKILFSVFVLMRFKIPEESVANDIRQFNKENRRAAEK